MHPLWNSIASRYHLSESMILQLIQYTHLLQAAAEHYNLTTIVAEGDIIEYHIADSLELSNIIDMNAISCFIDVGTGAGFPGLPLKIAYPQCTAVLIEVLAKRRTFLQQVAEVLNLEKVMIDERDWRTFLRTSQQPAQVVVARASLKPSELLRMFQPSSPYRTAQLVYWASEQWQPTAEEQKFLVKEHTYHVGDRTRKLVIFNSH